MDCFLLSVIDHLLWGFLNLNLTGAAREIFSNTDSSQGLEVWRKIHLLIYSKTERRQDELYVKIHNPNAAAHAGEVSKALEEWDTNQRFFRVVGGAQASKYLHTWLSQRASARRSQTSSWR